MKGRIIGVAGLSGSGKTAFACRLASILEGQVLALDSYYYGQGHLALEQRALTNYDHPDALDWPLLSRHLETLQSGQAIDQPLYLFDQHTRSVETRRLEPSAILILEGILTLHRAEIRGMLDMSVFVDTRPEECLRRRIARDISERGRTRDSVLEQYESTVWPMAEEYVLPSRRFADLVVSGEDSPDEAVRRFAIAYTERTGDSWPHWQDRSPARR